ncbi:MAG TPA: DUF4232 domain-containing protein [Rhodoglobus sp.]|nr:DUF4232 domain-containing protein [Rhodoglobus sp.]
MRPFALAALVLLLAGCASPTIEEPVDDADPACADLSTALEPRRDDDAVDLAVTNDGDTPCTLSGAPAVEVLSTEGEAIGVAPQPAEGADAVALAPGDVAYAVIEFDRGEADCDSSDTGGLRVTLPGTDEPIDLESVGIAFCAAGDEVLVGSFHSEPLPSQELQTTG